MKYLKALRILSEHPELPAKAFAKFYYDEPRYAYLFTASSKNSNGNARGKKAWLCAGSLLGRLVKKGYVERIILRDNCTRFRLTKEGTKYLSEHLAS